MLELIGPGRWRCEREEVEGGGDESGGNRVAEAEGWCVSW